MRKMGNFKGLPVFMVTDPFEWANMKNEGLYEEKIYVYATNVYYKWNRIAAINGDTLLDFNEDLFNELRRKSWDNDRAQILAHVTGSAETRPQEEEKSVKETVETPDRIVDSFMETWREKIDNEIAVLKSSIAQMEDVLNAVG